MEASLDQGSCRSGEGGAVRRHRLSVCHVFSLRPIILFVISIHRSTHSFQPLRPHFRNLIFG